MVRIQGVDVGATGYGLLGLTVRPGPEEQTFAAMKAAISCGAVCWNGAEFYGPPTANSLVLLNKYFTKYPEDTDKVLLSVKGAINPDFTPDSTPEGIRKSVENCVKALGGVKAIDFFACARVDPNVPIETSIGTLAELVKEGKIKGIALSEAKPDIIRRAHAVHPISAVEIELSLWSLDAITKGVTATCAELGIPIMAYSPLGQGFLTGRFKKVDDLAEGDFRRIFPRFQPETFEQNLKLVDALQAFAQKKGCTPAQLALAWVRNLSGRPGMPEILPIPGAGTASRVEENSKEVTLSAEDEKELDNILKGISVVGERFPAFSRHLAI